MRYVLISTATVLTLLFGLYSVVPASAAAQSREERDRLARTLYDEGDAAYQEGRYQAAIELFERAYELSERPALLFNLANALERLNRIDDAIVSLERYLPHSGSDRAQIETRIASLQQRLRDEQREAEAEARGEREQRTESELAETAAPPTATRPEQAGYVSAPGTVLTIGGGAAVASGVITGGFALSNSDRASESCVGDLCRADVESSLQSASDLAIATDVLLGVGVPMLVVGIVLLIVDTGPTDSPDTNPQNEVVSVAPYLSLHPTTAPSDSTNSPVQLVAGVSGRF